jgi:IS30 family transposase
MAHLTHSQRQLIENGLRNRRTFREIADSIGKSHTTVAREVLRHRADSDKGAPGRVKNRCVHRRECKRMNVCGDFKCSRRCSACPECNGKCRFFREDLCERLDAPPYVCNGCRDEHKCVLRKKYYIHDVAEEGYRKLLAGARRGACIAEGERERMAGILAAGFRLKQSVHHIMAANRDRFTVSQKTVYRYINSGILQHPKRHHLPMAPCMKPRRKKGAAHKVDTKCRQGRTLADYKAYREAHPDTPEVEMDSVIGRVGGKALLTIHFNNCGLLLAFLRDANTSQSVIDVFNAQEELLGTAAFKKLFPVILTDNGSEFSNPNALEESRSGGGRRTRIFYCDPYASWQKPHVENNHRNLRKIFPKGESMDNFTQEDVSLALSHINSMARESLNDRPAVELFEAIYGKKIIEKWGIRLVPPNEVRMTPKLIAK